MRSTIPKRRASGCRFMRRRPKCWTTLHGAAACRCAARLHDAGRSRCERPSRTARGPAERLRVPATWSLPRSACRPTRRFADQRLCGSRQARPVERRPGHSSDQRAVALRGRRRRLRRIRHHPRHRSGAGAAFMIDRVIQGAAHNGLRRWTTQLPVGRQGGRPRPPVGVPRGSGDPPSTA